MTALSLILLPGPVVSHGVILICCFHPPFWALLVSFFFFGLGRNQIWTFFVYFPFFR
jgi:hypothetical protein